MSFGQTCEIYVFLQGHALDQSWRGARSNATKSLELAPLIPKAYYRTTPTPIVVTLVDYEAASDIFYPSLGVQ